MHLVQGRAGSVDEAGERDHDFGAGAGGTGNLSSHRRQDVAVRGGRDYFATSIPVP